MSIPILDPHVYVPLAVAAVVLFAMAWMLVDCDDYPHEGEL